MRTNISFIMLVIQLILILCTSLIDGYVVKRLVDLHELNRFPRLRFLNSIDELSPLPLIVTEPDQQVTTKRTQSRRSVPTDEEIQAALNRLQSTSDLSQQMSKTYTKKSQQLRYKTLKKFNNGGSRNCFFSPIQCLVKFDLSKYKKLVDTTGMRRFND